MEAVRKITDFTVAEGTTSSLYDLGNNHYAIHVDGRNKEMALLALCVARANVVRNPLYSYEQMDQETSWMSSSDNFYVGDHYFNSNVIS